MTIFSWHRATALDVTYEYGCSALRFIAVVCDTACFSYHHLATK